MAKRKNPPIEAILVDCALATGRGIGARKISLEAVEFWAHRYKKSIAEALHNGAIWEKDRNAVLLMSVKLGRTARTLSPANKAISKANAMKAANIISQDPTCGAGGGRYCPTV